MHQPSTCVKFYLKYASYRIKTKYLYNVYSGQVEIPVYFITGESVCDHKDHKYAINAAIYFVVAHPSHDLLKALVELHH